MKYICRCGCEFEYELGKYGCPNCCGDSGAAKLVSDDYKIKQKGKKHDSAR
jgi:hypothetical protein